MQVLRMYQEEGVVQRIRASLKSLSNVLDQVRRMLCVAWTESSKKVVVEAHQIYSSPESIPNSNGYVYYTYLLFMDCEEITISENWRGDWIRLLGESKVAIFDAFQNSSTEKLLGADDFDVWIIENGFGELLGWELPDWYANDTEV